MPKCHNCKAPMEATIGLVSRKVAGNEYYAEVPAFGCTECQEKILDGAALERFELELARLLATTGTNDGDAVRFMRKAIGIKAQDVARLLGTTPESWSRWERGHKPIPEHFLAVFAVLVIDRVEGKNEVEQLLRAIQSDEPPPKEQRIRVHLEAA